MRRREKLNTDTNHVEILTHGLKKKSLQSITVIDVIFFLWKIRFLSVDNAGIVQKFLLV
jgi:hypothetical protein